jgi:hypothetical protein
MTVAVDNAGNTFMTWVGPGDQLAITKRPVGGNFETPQIIPVQAFEPQVAVDGAGNAVVVWTSQAGGSSIQQARRATNATQFTVGPVIDTDAGGGIAQGPRLDVNRAGQAVVGWDRGTTPNIQTRWAIASTTTNFGSGVIAGPSSTQAHKAGSVDINVAGDAAFAFRSNAGNDVSAAYHARNTTLASGSQLLSSDIPNDDPVVALDAQGRALAAWTTGLSAVEASYHPIGAAGAWTTPPTTLDTGAENDLGSVDVAFDAGDRGVVTWVAGSEVRTKTRPPGDPPAQFPGGAATVIPNEQAFNTSLGSADGGTIDLLIRRSSDFQIRASIRPPGGPFGTVMPVSEPGHQGSSHDIAEPVSLGNPSAAWVDTADATTTMASAVYDRTPPHFGATTSVPAKAFVGDPVPLVGSAIDDWTKGPGIAWDFGDGQKGSGPVVSHTYAAAGKYEVTITATDSVANTSSTTRPIEIVERPTRGVDFNASKVTGTVFVSVPKDAPAGRVLARPAVARGAAAIKPPKGYRRFRKLGADDNIPMGSILDTTRGTSDLTLAKSGDGKKRQRGRFKFGVFRTQQSRRSPLTTAVMLGGGDFRRECRRFGFLAKVNAARKRRRPHRRLFSNVKGRFRTRGRHSTASTRGTEFLVKDECKGTTTRVIKGSVSVRDLVKKRTRIVRAPHSYLARSPKR